MPPIGLRQRRQAGTLAGGPSGDTDLTSSSSSTTGTTSTAYSDGVIRAHKGTVLNHGGSSGPGASTSGGGSGDDGSKGDSSGKDGNNENCDDGSKGDSSGGGTGFRASGESVDVERTCGTG